MRIYKIDLKYLKYLHNSDYRVQYNINYSDSKNQNRPYIGPVLKQDGLFYYAPLEHPRPEHQALHSNNKIIKINGGRLGIIGINNMIPVPQEYLIDFDISQDKNSRTLISQLIYCRHNKRLLYHSANKTYFAKLKNADKHYSSCDFKLLAKKCNEYSNNRDIELNQSIAASSEQIKPILPNEIAGGGFTQMF